MHDNIVSTPKFVAFVIAFAALVTLLMINDCKYIPIIDDANVLLHEAGHLIFGLFGDTMGLYGGTLMQLVFPIVFAIAFWRQKSLVSVSIALLWLFENFFNIAAYIATTTTPGVYFVVGGGEHDWESILSRWGALQYDQTIATIVRVIGWVGLSSTLVWITYLWWRCRKSYTK